MERQLFLTAFINCGVYPMNDFIQLVSNYGPGVVAIAIIFWQFNTMPKLIRRLEDTLKDLSNLTTASVNILDKICDKLINHEKDVCQLECKIDNIQKDIDELRQDSKSTKENLAKIVYKDKG